MEPSMGRQAQPDWRNPSSYAYVRNQTQDGWFWEFLHRNGAFLRVARKLCAIGPASRQRGDPIDTMREGRGRSWGHVSLRERPIASPTLPHSRAFAARFNSLGGMVGEHTRLDHGLRCEAPARERWRPSPNIGAQMSRDVGRGGS